jgi:hypothetical protein
MEPHLIIIEEIMVMAVDMIGNEGDVLKILQERIPHLTIEMRITMKKKQHGNG